MVNTQTSIHCPIVAEKPQSALVGFLQRCGKLENADVGLIRAVAVKAITYLRGTKEARKRVELGQTLEKRWYASLLTGEPDWTVYGTEQYLGELWACWVVYSRTYLRACRSPRSLRGGGIFADLGPVQRIVDLGCGFGYTTAAFKEMFPSADITGTELCGTLQMQLARQMGAAYRFRLLSDVNAIRGPVDLVFASEYFEHIKAPVQHLRDILRVLKPKAFLVANAFGTRAIGHFEYYDVSGERVDGKTASKRFNAELRRQGFGKVATRLWNDRPVYWKRAQSLNRGAR